LSLAPDQGLSKLLKPNAANILRCAQHLIDGHLLGMPTETVYGLAADASQALAVNQIYAVKGRPNDHPLIVHVSGPSAAQYWFDSQLHPFAQALMDQFWPGPLTLIVNRLSTATAFACAGQSTIGLRAPSHSAAQSLLGAFESLGGYGIAAPSANRFGRVSPTTAQHVLDDLQADAPLVLDGGPCQSGIESTIIDISRLQPYLLRPGSIGLEQLQLCLGTKILLPKSIDQVTAPKVSGSLAAHYAPVTPMRIVDDQQLGAFIKQLTYTHGLKKQVRVVVIAMGAIPACALDNPRVVWIQASDNAQRFAHDLYANLRQADQIEADQILVQQPSQSPEWQAVHDRLGRSAFGSQQTAASKN
jgi:L-threonylcarbamoyladenylate synthase